MIILSAEFAFAVIHPVHTERELQTTQNEDSRSF
jgi:hypothetical protein